MKKKETPIVRITPSGRFTIQLTATQAAVLGNFLKEQEKPDTLQGIVVWGVYKGIYNRCWDKLTKPLTRVKITLNLVEAAVLAMTFSHPQSAERLPVLQSLILPLHQALAQ